MVDIRLYYWASQIVVINDWMHGGWTDSAYSRELMPLGHAGILNILYGGAITGGLPEVTSAVLYAWRGALTWIGWNKKPQ